MLKAFCDACGKETDRNFVSERLTGARHMNGREFRFEVLVAKDDVWNSGELCELCLRKLIEAPQRG